MGQKKMEEELQQKAQEELRRKTEEDQKKLIESKASLTVLFSLTNLAGALPENFEKLKANFERTVQLELPRTGMRQKMLMDEAQKTLRHANKYVGQVREQRARVEAWQQEKGSKAT